MHTWFYFYRNLYQYLYPNIFHIYVTYKPHISCDLQNLKTLSSEEREWKTMILTGGPFGPGNPTGPWGPWGPWKEKAVGKSKHIL